MSDYSDDDFERDVPAKSKHFQIHSIESPTKAAPSKKATGGTKGPVSAKPKAGGPKPAAS